MNTTRSFASRTPEVDAGSAETPRGTTIPALNRIATDADQFARRGVKAVRQSSEHLRGQASRARVSMARYVDDEPVKAVLIAAAAGAALMALRNLTVRSMRG